MLDYGRALWEYLRLSQGMAMYFVFTFNSFPISKDFHFFDKYHQIPYDRKAVKENYSNALKLQQAALKY